MCIQDFVEVLNYKLVLPCVDLDKVVTVLFPLAKLARKT